MSRQVRSYRLPSPWVGDRVRDEAEGRVGRVQYVQGEAGGAVEYTLTSLLGEGAWTTTDPAQLRLLQNGDAW
ncbi:hypothetical protein [Streptomyces sp. NPDC002851]